MISKLVGMMPTLVERVAFNNALLEEVPPGLDKLASLNELYLNYNNITKVDASMALDTLSELDLLGNQIESFDAVFPKLIHLGLSTNRLSEIPSVVPKHTRLEELWLNNNSISEVTESHGMETVKSIYFTHNQISRFEAYFPNLEFLDMGGNKLTEIPPIIFNHTKLKTLKLAGNLFDNVILTNDQATFFANMANFTFDAGSINKECYVYQQREVHGMNFCIGDTSATTVAEKKSGSSSTPIIIGVVGGVVVLGLVIGLLVFRARKNKRGKKSTNTTQDGTMFSATNTLNSTAVTSLWNDCSAVRESER
jgi:Leucine-rich repeat (LRR) protein